MEAGVSSTTLANAAARSDNGEKVFITVRVKDERFRFSVAGTQQLREIARMAAMTYLEQVLEQNKEVATDAVDRNLFCIKSFVHDDSHVSLESTISELNSSDQAIELEGKLNRNHQNYIKEIESSENSNFTFNPVNNANSKKDSVSFKNVNDHPNTSVENSNTSNESFNSPTPKSPPMPTPSKPLFSQSKSFMIPYFDEYSFEEIHSATAGFSENRLVGRGSFGHVYKGELNGSVVAIKRLSDRSNFDRLTSELRMLGRAHHPNVVQLYGACYHPKALCVVTEYLTGGSLSDRIMKRKPWTVPLDWKQRIRIVSEIVSALTYLHKKKIVHRDLKPANVLLDGFERVKVTDMGLARHFDKTVIIPHLEGSAGHIDPHFMETHEVKKESDIFSFGVTSLELLIGQSASEVHRILREHCEDSRDLQKSTAVFLQSLDNSAGNWNIKISADVIMLLIACLNKDFRKRPEEDKLQSKLNSLAKMALSLESLSSHSVLESEGAYVLSATQPSSSASSVRTTVWLIEVMSEGLHDELPCQQLVNIIILKLQNASLLFHSIYLYFVYSGAVSLSDIDSRVEGALRKRKEAVEKWWFQQLSSGANHSQTFLLSQMSCYIRLSYGSTRDIRIGQVAASVEPSLLFIGAQKSSSSASSQFLLEEELRMWSKALEPHLISQRSKSSEFLVNSGHSSGSHGHSKDPKLFLYSEGEIIASCKLFSPSRFQVTQALQQKHLEASAQSLDSDDINADVITFNQFLPKRNPNNLRSKSLLPQKLLQEIPENLRRFNSEFYAVGSSISISLDDLTETNNFASSPSHSPEEKSMAALSSTLPTSSPSDNPLNIDFSLKETVKHLGFQKLVQAVNTNDTGSHEKICLFLHNLLQTNLEEKKKLEREAESVVPFLLNMLSSNNPLTCRSAVGALSILLQLKKIRTLVCRNLSLVTKAMKLRSSRGINFQVLSVITSLACHSDSLKSLATAHKLFLIEFVTLLFEVADEGSEGVKLEVVKLFQKLVTHGSFKTRLVKMGGVAKLKRWSVGDYGNELKLETNKLIRSC